MTNIKLLIGLLAILLQASVEMFTVAVFIYGLCLAFSIAFTMNIVLGIWLMIEAARVLVELFKK